MKNLTEAVALLFLALAFWLGWNAFQINFKDRVDLVRLGNRSLPGAGRLKSQFAGILFLQGLCSASTAAVILVLGSLQPAVWLYLVATAILLTRRAVLVRGLERYAIESHSEIKPFAQPERQ